MFNFLFYTRTCSILCTINDEQNYFLYSNKSSQITRSGHVCTRGQKTLRANLFWDMFNYIYDLMEFYRHAEAFVVGIRKACQYATHVEFAVCKLILRGFEIEFFEIDKKSCFFDLVCFDI
jgi:hypothetical protein